MLKFGVLVHVVLQAQAGDDALVLLHLVIQSRLQGMYLRCIRQTHQTGMYGLGDVIQCISGVHQTGMYGLRDV